MLRMEVIFSAFLLFISAIGLYASTQLNIFHRGGEMGPGFFPLVLSSLLIVLSIIYIGYVLKNIKSDSKGTEKKRMIDYTFVPHVFYAGLLIVCLLIIPFIGMLGSLALFSFFILMFIEKIVWYRSFIFSVLLLAGIYIIFDVLLGMRIPMGSLF